MIRKPTSKVLSRYFASRSSETEKALVEAWVMANPKNRELLDKLKRIWEISGRVGEEWDSTHQLERLSTMMKETGGSSGGDTNLKMYKIAAQPHHKVLPLRPIVSVAAAIIALIGTIYAVHYLKDIVLENEIRAHNGSFVVQEAATKPGQQVSLQFADGTRVVLNSASNLRYSTSPDGTRNVYLEGEAYFTVVHSDVHPFVVHTEYGSIKDIGTQFDVRAWNDDRVVQVAVIKGVVSVQTADAAQKYIVLNASQYSVIDKNGVMTPPTYMTNVTKYISWMDGKYAFYNDPFSLVVQQIWRTYGVNCFVSDTSLLSRKITTAFSSRDPVKRVVDIIALSLHLSYKMSSDSVLFIPSKQASSDANSLPDRRSSSLKKGERGE